MSPAVAAVILAAGRGARYGGGQNKLLAEIDGEPLLRRVASSALESRVCATIVVTGHARGAVEAALAPLPVRFVHNPNFATGLSSSLRAGVSAVEADAALIILGDMPGVSSGVINALIAAFDQAPECAAIAPSCSGRRGNPVLLSRKIFPHIALLEGDEGARKLLGGLDGVVELPLDDAGVLADVDTPADLRGFKRSLYSRP
jgi:molybdenum cofactor cytidylyltransferase